MVIENLVVQSKCGQLISVSINMVSNMISSCLSLWYICNVVFNFKIIALTLFILISCYFLQEEPGHVSKVSYERFQTQATFLLGKPSHSFTKVGVYITFLLRNFEVAFYILGLLIFLIIFSRLVCVHC